MKIKNKKIVFIGEDGKPETNADGTFKIQTIYRGFTEQESYTKQFQKKAKNLTKREDEALKKYHDLKKEQEIDRLLQDNGIDNQFITLVKKTINKDEDIEKIKTSINELITKIPKIKKTLNTGGINLIKDDEKDDIPSDEYQKIIG